MTNEAAYWEAREAAKEAALKMAAGLSARDKGLVCMNLKFQAANEAEHDQTMQRLFEKSFLSIDRPNEDGSTFDYFFRNREVNRVMRAIDEPYRDIQRELRFRRALYLLRRYPSLCDTLLAIRRHRRREAIRAALQIDAETYRIRFMRIVTLLGLDIP